MSAWYVLSAMGLHPICPGDNKYQITSPVFEKIEIQLDKNYYQGNTFTIVANNNSSENIYIQSKMGQFTLLKFFRHRRSTDTYSYSGPQYFSAYRFPEGPRGTRSEDRRRSPPPVSQPAPWKRRPRGGMPARTRATSSRSTPGSRPTTRTSSHCSSTGSLMTLESRVSDELEYRLVDDA